MGNAVGAVVAGMVVIGVLVTVVSRRLIARDLERSSVGLPAAHEQPNSPESTRSDERWDVTYRRTALNFAGWHGPWPMFRVGVSPQGLSIPVFGSRVGRSVASSAGLDRIPVDSIERIVRAGGLVQYGFRVVLDDERSVEMWSPRLPSLLRTSPPLAVLIDRDERHWFWAKRVFPASVTRKFDTEESRAT